jgi:small subunit ribosomal protein S4
MGDKCSFARRPEPPGVYKVRRAKVSEYKIQLREKQKVRSIYGVLERQFRNYFRRAERMKGLTGENLLSLLERRLESVVYNLGWAISRPQARQLIVHRHLLVNDRVVNIPSFLVKKGDSISIHKRRGIEERIREFMRMASHRGVPAWLEADPERLYARVVRNPTRSDVIHQIEEDKIIALYSR